MRSSQPNNPNQIGVATAPPTPSTTKLPERAPAQHRNAAHAEQQQQGQHLRGGAAAQPEDQLGEGLVTQDQVALELDRQPDHEEREHGHPQRVG